MRIARVSFLLLSFALPASMAAAQIAAAAQTGTAEQPAGRVQLSVDDLIDKMSEAETEVINRLKMYHPLMEVYLQNLAPDETRGWVPTDDNYFLGQFYYDEVPTLRTIGQKNKRALMVRVLGTNAPDLGNSFAAMAAPDWRVLDRTRYEFKFVRREFLGESRCFVFDVKPLKNRRDGFVGRVWIEDRGYNMVRFNGINPNTDQRLSKVFRRTTSFHVDGWRVNVLPGVWLPSYIYSEETDLTNSSKKATRFKSQMRIWGYEAQGDDKSDALTTIRIDEPNVSDTDAATQLSPVLSQRRWEQEAEANVLERLENVGLLAPAGEADKVLETVLNNIIVTNKLPLERPMHCRILLTSPLESFTVGHTIVLSRGLVDVLPDEASLATMLAHELSHVVLGHALIDTKFSFADRLMIADADLLPALTFRHTEREEAAADEKVIELLGKSPYRDKLADAGLFLRTLSEKAAQLPKLIQPHIGDFMAANGQMTRMADLMAKAPALQPDSLEQITALQLGARLIVDPWSGRLTLDRSPAVPLTSVREKVPLAVTPLMPVIRYAEPLDAGGDTPVRTVGAVRAN